MHDLRGVFVIQARLFVVDIQAVIIVFLAVKAEKIVAADYRSHVSVIDQSVVKIVFITAVLVLRRVFADPCFDRVLVDVADGDQQLVLTFNRRAVKAGLKETSDPRVFFVVPGNVAGRDILKDPAERHFPGFHDHMYMI